MNQLDQLLALYKEAQTDAEKRLLLEAAQICSPSDLPRLKEMILREELEAVPLDQLAATIATRRGVTLEEAEKELRELVFEHLLQRSVSNAAPLADSEARKSSAISPLIASPTPPKTKVVILDGPGQPLATSEGRCDEDISRSPTATSFGRLQPRGIGG